MDQTHESLAQQAVHRILVLGFIQFRQLAEKITIGRIELNLRQKLRTISGYQLDRGSAVPLQEKVKIS